jgi:nitrate/TMAO reductase-like tetraheme cytochrome c subunit
MKVKIIMIAVLGIVLYSCSRKIVPQEQPEKVVVKEVTVEVIKEEAPQEVASYVMLTAELAEGKDLFENNCAKCHKLYNPKDFTAEQWTPILINMQKNADLSDEQRIKVYNYVTMK